jgi:hypothetical protein
MVVVEKPEGKRPFGRTRCRWEDYTKIGVEGHKLDSFDSGTISRLM